MGHYCDNRKALGSYIIIMAHVGFPSRRSPDTQAAFLRRFLKSLCLTGCLALVVRPCLKSSLFSLSPPPPSPACRCQPQMRIVVPLEPSPTAWALALGAHHRASSPLRRSLASSAPAQLWTGMRDWTSLTWWSPPRTG